MEQVNTQFVRFSNARSRFSVGNLLAAIRFGVPQEPNVLPQNTEKVRRFTPIQRSILDAWMIPHARGLYINDNTRAGFWSRLISAVNGYCREAYSVHMGYIPTRYYLDRDGVFHLPLDAKPGTMMTVTYTTNGGRHGDRDGNRASRRKRR